MRRALHVELVRVRDIAGKARIEVASGRVAEAGVRRAELTRALLELGFSDVVIDPTGYREGGADAKAPR